MTAMSVGVLWTYRGALHPVTAPVPAATPTPSALARLRRRGADVLAVAGPTARQVSAIGRHWRALAGPPFTYCT